MTAYDIGTYNFEKNERFFYDTNVWAAINGLAAFTPDSTPYSAAHKRILTVGASICTDQTVLQEFANLQEREAVAVVRQTRLGQTNKLGPKETKAFRVSNPTQWNEVAEIVTDALRQIIRQSQLLPFSSESLNNALTFYRNGSSGFNDAVIAQACLSHNCALITHDAEFAFFDVKIITAYSNLLNSN